MKYAFYSILLTASLSISPAAARSFDKQSGMLGSLFDAGTPVKVSAFGSDAGAPKIEEAGPAEPEEAPVKTLAERKAELHAFVDAFGEKILAVPGIVSVHVGIDCAVIHPHVHVRPHMPAVVIRIGGGIPGELVHESLMKSVPELSGLIYRMETVPQKQPEPASDDARCWLPEGC